MPAAAADRNLLFGILALQMDFVSRDALVAAMNAWVLAKAKPLGQVLMEQGALANEEHGLLEALVQKHLARHGNDAERSLAALGPVGGVRDDLRHIADPDVEASLARVGGPEGGDVFATRGPPSMGAPTSGGQRFRILRPHARGGLGEVYVASDDELHREVALKEIQGRHADDPESRSRFLLEAEVTGGLEHPGIVPVYGLGVYADGRPFYAMRFIRGDSLKDAIARFHQDETLARDPGKRGLELRGLLGRFVDVCNAIEYAHSRGVLHRDLKPANVMLGSYGETLVVDWGLAKPLEKVAEGVTSSMEGPLRPSSASASHTMAGPALGTPQYMSPEQAMGRIDVLGPASDVYSLGATLYCLLTGRPPVTDADVGTVLHKVQTGDFPPPRKVKPDVPPALEAVCLKAMALLARERYPSPGPLARDLERWLADEPVSAWREPWTVRVGRWVRRHRTLVTAGVAALVVAAVTLGAGAALLARANEQLREANAKAEHNYRLARQAVDRYDTEVSEDFLLNQPGMQPLRKKLLEAAREFYEQFVQERRDDAEARAELGRALFRLAQITGDIESETKAIDLHQEAVKVFTAAAEGPADDEKADLAACYHHLGRLYRLTDQLGKAEESYGKALAAWEELARVNPGEDRYQAEIARSRLGLGSVFQRAYQLDRAQDLYEQALAARRELARRHADVAEYARDVAVTLSNLAMIYTSTGQAEKTEASLTDCLKLQKDLAGAHPDVSQYQNDLARSHYNLADWYFESEQVEKAEAPYRKAIELWQNLVEKHPVVTDFQTNLSEAYLSLANLYRTLDDMPRAKEAGKQALDIKEKLARANPQVPAYQAELALCYVHLGNLSGEAGSRADAAAAYEKALAIQEPLVRDGADSLLYKKDLARTYNKLGLVRAADGQKAQAEEALRKAVALWDEQVRRRPGEPEAALGLCWTCQDLGNLCRANGDPRAALTWYGEALQKVPAVKDTYYSLACVAALASATEDSRTAADAHAARAMELLGQARAAGYFKTPANLEKLRRTTDFDALRGRDDFKKLLAELGQGS